MSAMARHYDIRLDKDGYVLVMVDGKNFSTMIKNRYDKPFSDEFIGLMDSTARYVCENVDGCKFAYVQSDEITFVITSFDKKENMPYFDNRLLKLCSIIPSLATAKFNSMREKSEKLCVFDAKVFPCRSFTDAYSFLLWRQNDCVRNSKQQAAQTYLDKRSLLNKNTDEQIRLLRDTTGIEWDGYDDGKKYGRFIYKVNETHINPDGEEYTRGRWKVNDAFLLGGDGREKLKSLGAIPVREPANANRRFEPCEFWRCPKCGGNLIWENDYDCSDVFGDEWGYRDVDGSIITQFRCADCGRSVEVTDPTPDMKEEQYSDYWFN